MIILKPFTVINFDSLMDAMHAFQPCKIIINRKCLSYLCVRISSYFKLIEKEQDLTQSYDDSPYTNRKFNDQLTTQNAVKNVDYTTIADRFRTVSWSNNNYPTFCLWVSNLPTNRKAVYSKRRTNRQMNNMNNKLNVQRVDTVVSITFSCIISLEITDIQRISL